MSDDPQDQDYKVGKGNPPKHTQWKKGQSGNPSGNKKKDDSFQAMLEKLAGEEILVHKNGAAMSMTRKEAVVSAVIAKAMKGDLACVKFIHSELGLETGGAGPAIVPELSADILDVLQSHTDWVGICEEAEARLSEPDEGMNDAEVNADVTD